MATQFSQDAVLDFLCSRGGSVKNSDLISHFKTFLREHENQVQHRDMFKRFVNSVAVVKRKDGVSIVILRNRYRELVGEDISSAEKGSSSGSVQELPVNLKETSTRQNADREQVTTRLNVKQSSRAKSGVTDTYENDNIQFSAAETAYSDVRTSEQNQKRFVNSPSCMEPVERVTNNPTHVSKSPQIADSKYQDCIIKKGVKPLQPCDYSAGSGAVGFSSKQHPSADFTKENPFSAKSQQFGSVNRERLLSEWKDLDYGRRPLDQSSNQHTKNNGLISKESFENSAQRCISQREGSNTTHSTQPVCLLPSRFSNSRLNPSSRLSRSSHCIASMSPEAKNACPDSIATSSSSENLSNKGCRLAAFKSIRCKEITKESFEKAPPEPQHSNPLVVERFIATASDDDKHVQCFSVKPKKHKKETNQGCFQTNFLSTRQNAPLHQSNECIGNLTAYEIPSRADMEGSSWRNSTGNIDYYLGARQAHHGRKAGVLLPMHSGDAIGGSIYESRKYHSMDAETSECVPFLQASPQQHPSKMRLPSPDIDRPFNPPGHPEPPKYDPNTKSKILKSNEDLYSHKSTLVPLESREHDWLVKAAAGAWDQIYILFREDHSLLNKKDFISGYTVLHWIAKHGDHRVLNTLCYGVNKRGLALDVDVKSSCGYTALHLAAIHGHKSIIRLLVHKYKANVNLRDTSGKKPWHYLDRREFTGDLGVLLGAPSSKNTAAAAYQSASEKQDLSFSPSVKRNTSFAAFLRPHHLWKGAQF
ncbi:uncharacterized protein LOC117408996 [Acipenser ruthenus]|uniref:uncharacterized protein LOC117408996 n=1 Tax=Acipenser ruthenus TaxID=7906 RepID=UPI00145AAA1A|nr:uncharacterized protein LOC117408996 [Acipenser ruthenus]